MYYDKIFLKVNWSEDLFECKINTVRLSIIADVQVDKAITFTVRHPKHGGEYVYTWISSPSRGQAFLKRDGIATNDPTEEELGRQIGVYALQHIALKEPIKTY